MYTHVRFKTADLRSYSPLYSMLPIEKNTERIYTERKNCLKITMESIGDGVVTTDIEGRITSLNDSANVITGWGQGGSTGASL